MQKRIFILSLFFYALQLCTFTTVGYAANEHLIVSKTGNQIVTNAALNINDQWLAYMHTNGIDNSQFYTVQGLSNVVLRFDQSRLDNFQTSWTLSVAYTLELYDEHSALTATHPGTLAINFNNSSSYKDKDFIRYSGQYYKAKLIIGTVTYNGSSSTPIPALFANDIFVDLEQETERFYKITTTPFVYTTTIDQDNDHELPIAWTFVQGAESYDAEWLFVDIGQESFTLTGGYGFDFRDATRINTANQSYSIPLAYPRGILLYRVRGVGTDPVTGELTQSSWSYNNSSLTGSTSTVPSGTNAYRLNYNGLNSNYNWQYSASYAESGKRKEVISYFDGSLRNRQTSTILNTDKNALIAETKYDFEGRGAVQLLPTPVTSTGIHFNTNFNENFDKNAFDNNTTIASPGIVDGSNATGVYYASNGVATGIDAYTPDAEGYPYSRTTYKKDGTNRVTKQSGVGPAHKIGSGHETKYYYGTPTGQEELDRLFGNEVGNWKHYKKNMVLDPNGQVSITYMDQEGRTIATALAGEHPDNLLEIDLKPAASEITADLLTGKNNLANDALISTSTVTVSTPNSDYVFTYNLGTEEHCETEPCTTQVCKTCKYDLDISITNEENEPVSFTSGVDIYATGTASYTNISALSSFTFTAQFADIGTYTVSKNLRLNQESVTEYYNAMVLVLKECVPYNTVAQELCLDCEGICTQTFKIPLAMGGYDYVDENGVATTQAHADELIAACRVLCSAPTTAAGKSECELKYQAMIADLSPGGQYFDNLFYNTTTGLFNATSNDNGWLEANLSDDPDFFTDFTAWRATRACSTAATLDSWVAIRDNWKPCFADYLVLFHPEYCQYEFNCTRPLCSSANPVVNISSSNDFDKAMQGNYASEAYYIPSGLSVYTTVSISDNSGYIGTTGLPTQLIDPYFDPNSFDGCSTLNDLAMLVCTSGTTTQDEITVLNSLLQHYATAGTSGTPVYLSIWYILDDPGSIHTAASALDASGVVGFTVPENVYQMFRNLHGNGAGNDGLLGGTIPLMTKYQYFVNIYQGIKKSIQYQRYDSYLSVTPPLPRFCGFLKSSDTRMGWTDATSSFQLRYPDNNLLKTVWDNTCYNTTDNIVQMTSGAFDNLQELVAANTPDPLSLEMYRGNCAQYASQWMKQLQDDCSGVTSFFTTDTVDVKNYLIEICAHGASPINALGSSECFGCNIDGPGATVFNTFDEVRDYYADLYSVTCTTTVVHPPDEVNDRQVICSCEKYDAFISEHGLGSATDIQIAAAITDFYGLTGAAVVSDSHVNGWQANCLAPTTFTLADFTKLPAGLSCVTSANAPYNAYSCTCTNLHNYIDALPAGSSTSNADVATALSADFAASISGSQVSDWLAACASSTFTSSTFSALPAILKCMTKEECTANNFMSFVINHGFPEPYPIPPTPHTYTTGEKLDIAAAINASYSAAVDATDADVGDWLTAYFAATYTSSTFDNMPVGMKCSDNALPPPVCACELENLQAAADADFMNEQSQLAAARVAAAAFIERYKTKCLNTLARETFTVVYDLDEYQYTLYYYDQAGSLLKTVPPQGTELLTTTTQLNNVADHRAAVSGSTFTVPNHRMVTHYWYNSLEQLIKQYTPDGDSAWFYYDALGRLVVSQNAKQKNYTTPAYSFTLYDALGRIYEVGELNTLTAMTNATSRDNTALLAWIVDAAATKNQLTKTTYDGYLNGTVNGYFGTPGQENLRNRVSTATYTDAAGASTYNHASHYSYDIHGNVKTLIQENTSLAGISQDLKRMDYEYDLISGKVNEVKYQEGAVDAFFTKYEYDADIRLTNVYTSKDNVIWDQDAKYFYYAHGPLSRVEIGDKKVQAIDYAYTIQNWIKGVNSNTLDATRDIGKDGEENINNLNRNIGRDAFGYSLNYFTNDYTPIGTIASIDNFIASTTSATYLSTDAPGLYNGNISSMVTTIADLSNSALPQLTAYRYDQLNRIKQMKAYRDINSSTNAWGSGSTYDGSYQEQYSYNANGSILSLERNGLASIASGAMDNMTYKYETVANGYTKNTNKLRYIQDAIGSSTYTDDMDDQSVDNFGYDEIGNLIKDDFECIQNIEWTVSGKVKKVTRTPSCTTESSTMPDLEFNYNANGDLIEKIVKPEATLADASTWIHTYYVYDANENIMATYEKLDTDFTLTEQQLYGSNHIGTAKRDLDMSTSLPTTEFSRTVGKKQFFLNDHRNNNNVTVLDRLKPIESTITSGTIAYYEPVIDRAVDYFPFGREENGRIFNRGNSEFGYNGELNIKEWSSRLGGSQLYGKRIKFGEGFLSVDPLTGEYPFYSPYQFAGNTPIQAIDLDGLEPMLPMGNGVFTPPSDQTQQAITDPAALKYLDALSEGAGESANRTLSTVLDFTPVVGTIKNWTEAVTGEDVITGAEIPTWVRAVSVMPYGKVVGKAGDFVKVATKSADKVIEQSAKHTDDVAKIKVHGNSKASTKETTLYRLETKDGDYLKTGVTSKANPEKRYTNAFMKDKKMIILDKGSRGDMLKKERGIVEKTPGPLNKEKWAGKKK